MDLDFVAPIPDGTEAVPGEGLVTWTGPAQRRGLAADLLSVHRPTEGALHTQLLWPLLSNRSTCAHCGDAYPCTRAAWAHQALGDAAGGTR